MHGGGEVTELSTNKQHTLSQSKDLFATTAGPRGSYIKAFMAVEAFGECDMTLGGRLPGGVGVRVGRHVGAR